MKQIPMLDLKPELDEIRSEIEDAIRQVIESGQYILGSEVEGFERNAARYLELAFAYGVNSGTDAIVIGLRAVGVKPRDEIITTPFTFFATAEGIENVGGRVVFADIEPNTFNLDPVRIEEKITSRTRAILPVHIYGHPVDMTPIMDLAAKHNLVVVEDVAQAFGSTYNGLKTGTIGDIGAFSFFPSKNLGAMGDGGLVATNSPLYAERVRMLRAHGAHTKYKNEIIGYNSRLDALQAAILNVKLRYIDRRNSQRRNVASLYNEALSDLQGIVTPIEMPYAKHVYHQYTIRVLGGHRDIVRKSLQRDGISTMIYYPHPVHQLPVYAGRKETLLVTEKCSKEVLSLPIWPHMSESTVDRISTSIKKCLR